MKIKDFIWFVSGFFPAWDHAYAGELLQGFKLDPEKKIGALSKGMAAKVALTVGLAPRPELLILDDPTIGLDVVVRREFLESIVSVIHEEERTVFISTHQIDEVERVADHVAILDDGQLIRQSSLQELKDSVRRVRLVVTQDFEEPGGIEGILSRERSDRMWTGVVTGLDDEKISRFTALSGVTAVDVDQLPLEDIFCAVAGGAA